MLSYAGALYQYSHFNILTVKYFSAVNNHFVCRRRFALPIIVHILFFINSFIDHVYRLNVFVTQDFINSNPVASLSPHYDHKLE